jgi:hypothetical protein
MKKRVARLLAVPLGVGLALFAWANVAANDAPPPELRADMQPVLLSTVNLGLNICIEIPPLLDIEFGDCLPPSG